MVLSNRSISIRVKAAETCTGPYNGVNIREINVLTLQSIFFKLCKACQQKTMASIPPSAFSAGRIRETQCDMKISKPSKSGDSVKYYNNNFMELSPLKYISKLMDSIWGNYNRYSPHNVKKVNDAFIYTGEMQQYAASPANKGDSKITVPSKLDNVWAAINVSQSH